MLNGDCHFNIYMYYTSWVLSRCREAYSVRCIGEWKSVECVDWTQAFVQTQILCIRHVDLWVINNDTNTCMKSKPNNHLKTDCVIICMKWAGDYGWFHGICVLTDRFSLIWHPCIKSSGVLSWNVEVCLFVWLYVIWKEINVTPVLDALRNKQLKLGFLILWIWSMNINL